MAFYTTATETIANTAVIHLLIMNYFSCLSLSYSRDLFPHLGFVEGLKSRSPVPESCCVFPFGALKHAAQEMAPELLPRDPDPDPNHSAVPGEEDLAPQFS